MSNNTNTSAATVAATSTPTMRRYWRNLSALDMAVIKQLTGGDGVARNLGGGQCEIDEDTAEQLANVCRCSCGAGGGFGGFIYYYETWAFFRANRAAIVAALQEMAEGIGEGCAVDLVRGFNCFKDDKPSADEVGRLLWGEIPAEWSEGSDIDEHCVANACAWGALEDLAFALDGQEAEEEERRAE